MQRQSRDISFNESVTRSRQALTFDGKCSTRVKLMGDRWAQVTFRDFGLFCVEDLYHIVDNPESSDAKHFVFDLVLIHYNIGPNFIPKETLISDDREAIHKHLVEVLRAYLLKAEEVTRAISVLPPLTRHRAVLRESGMGVGSPLGEISDLILQSLPPVQISSDSASLIGRQFSSSNPKAEGYAALYQQTAAESSKQLVFLVHGGEHVEEVKKVIEAGGTHLALNLRGRPSTWLANELSEAMSKCSAAVVIVSPDRDEPNSNRVRPNVATELGRCIEKYGLDKVCIIKIGEVDFGSDYAGLVYLTSENYRDELPQWLKTLKD